MLIVLLSDNNSLRKIDLRQQHDSVTIFVATILGDLLYSNRFYSNNGDRIIVNFVVVYHIIASVHAMPGDDAHVRNKH